MLIYAIIHQHAFFLIENPMTSLVRILTLMCCGFVCALMALSAKGLFWIFGLAELPSHPRIAEIFASFNIFDAFTWLGEFGSSTPKPVRLWSNSTFIGNLRRTLLMIYSPYLMFCMLSTIQFGLRWAKPSKHHLHVYMNC